MTDAIMVGKHYFKYDREQAIVRMYSKLKDNEFAEMRQDNIEWQKKYGKNLWDIDEDGLFYLDGAGLMREHWDDEEAREEYLIGMEMDWEDDTSYLVEDCKKEFGF